jgi:hypothetical protein
MAELPPVTQPYTLGEPEALEEEEEEEEENEVEKKQEITTQSNEKTQEELDREFALKLSERLNNAENLPPSPSHVPQTPVITEPSPINSTTDAMNSDFELALRLSQELNAGPPVPPQTLYTPIYAPPPTVRPVVSAPLPPSTATEPLSQEEQDRRLALELNQALNVDETADREVALRFSQQFNNSPAPPRTAYPIYQTPGAIPGVPYVQQRSAEEIRIEVEIGRVTKALSNPANDADTKMALDLQLQELVAYQRQLQRRRIQTDDESDDDDFLEDGIKMLDVGYEKFKGFSKEMVSVIDKYGGKVENVWKNLVGSKVDETTDKKTDETTGETTTTRIRSSTDGAGDEAVILDEDEQPLSKNLRKRRSLVGDSTDDTSSTIPPSSPASLERKEKGLSLRLVEKLDEVGDEIGSTVADLFFGGNSNGTKVANQPSPPPSLPPHFTTENTSAPTTTTTTTRSADLPDFKGGSAKDSDDSLFPL